MRSTTLTQQLTLVQLDSNGMWSVRNEHGDRVGYFAFRSEAQAWLESQRYELHFRNDIGSTWVWSP